MSVCVNNTKHTIKKWAQNLFRFSILCNFPIQLLFLISFTKNKDAFYYSGETHAFILRQIFAHPVPN
jgi:hypothetical protein